MEALTTYKPDNSPALYGYEPEADWDNCDYSCNAIPNSLAELKKHIRLSEEQIDEGRYMTAQAAIAHFNQL
ncbi:MAG: hypothetical protein IJT98_07655 [Prevotella sp.]|nr:hypothetical protein [Prevotella sp.]